MPSSDSNENEENTNDLPARKIPRNYFVSGRKITETHAAYHAGRSMQNGVKNSVKEVLNEMRKIDEDGKIFAGVRVKKLMVNAAKERRILRRRDQHGLCNTFDELKNRWKKWVPVEEPELCKDFFYVAIGYFDEHKDWDTKLEQEFMSENNYEYEVETEVKKCKGQRVKAPCILDLIRKRKSYYAKLLFHGAKTTHKLYLSTSGTDKESKGDFRRKKGVYNENLLRVHGKKGCPANIGNLNQMLC